MDKTSIIEKIKKLKKLATSPNEFEANSAKELAKTLMENNQISDQDLSDISLFQPSNFLFETLNPNDPFKLMAYTICSAYKAFILEQQEAYENSIKYNYFCFSKKESKIQFLTEIFKEYKSNTEKLLSHFCQNKNENYKTSYLKGIIEGLRRDLDSDVYRAQDEEGMTDEPVIEKEDIESKLYQEIDKMQSHLTDELKEHIEQPEIYQQISYDSKEFKTNPQAYLLGKSHSNKVHPARILSQSSNVLPDLDYKKDYIDEYNELMRMYNEKRKK